MLVLRWTTTPIAAGTACNAAFQVTHGPSGPPESGIPPPAPLLELEWELMAAPPVPLLELGVAPPVPLLELGPVTVDELVAPGAPPVAFDLLADEQAAPRATTNTSGKPRPSVPRRILELSARALREAIA
jgi:hypothetical protein